MSSEDILRGLRPPKGPDLVLLDAAGRASGNDFGYRVFTSKVSAASLLQSDATSTFAFAVPENGRTPIEIIKIEEYEILTDCLGAWFLTFAHRTRD